MLNCNYTDSLYVHGTLYTIVGRGENEHFEWQDEADTSQVGSYASVDRVRICVDHASARWVVKAVARANALGYLQPNPCWSDP